MNHEKYEELTKAEKITIEIPAELAVYFGYLAYISDNDNRRVMIWRVLLSAAADFALIKHREALQVYEANKDKPDAEKAVKMAKNLTTIAEEMTSLMERLEELGETAKSI